MFYNEFIFLNNVTINFRFISNFAVEKISQLLQEKGFNRELALSRATEVFGKEVEKATVYMHNLQLYFDKDIMKKIYDYIAQKALFKEQLQLSSYDNILRLVQHTYRCNLSKQELDAIRQISKANHYGILLNSKY